MLQQDARAMKQRILCLIGFDRLERRIAGFHIRARMAHQTHGAHVQEYRFATTTRIGNGFFTTAHRIEHVDPVALDIVQRWAVGEIRLYPTTWRAHRNADAIILAQEDQRHGQVLVSRPASRVDCTLRRRMVGRRVAKRAQDNRIVRQHRIIQFQALRHADAVRSAHGLWQMRCDGAGLRRDKGLCTTKHLVAPTRDRILRRSGKAKRHIVKRRQSACLFLALNQESRIAIVQEGHIGLTRGRGHCRGAFVARTADGIKGLSLRSPGPQIEMPRHDLAVENIDQLVGGRNVEILVAARRWQVTGEHALGKAFVDYGRAIKHARGFSPMLHKCHSKN